jgi:hypothetical protein
MSRNLGALTLLDPSGPAWPVMGVLYLLTLHKGDSIFTDNNNNNLSQLPSAVIHRVNGNWDNVPHFFVQSV